MVAPKRKRKAKAKAIGAKSTDKSRDKSLANLAPPWKKGESGNAEGRKPGTKNRKTLMGQAFLSEAIGDEDVKAEVLKWAKANPQFFTWAYEQVFGKATQKIEHSGGEDFGARNVSVVLVLHQEIAAMMAEGLVTREVRDRLRGCLPAGDDGDD